MPNRLMGDAIHVNVPQLAQVPGLQLAGLYNTGTIDIKATPADIALFTARGIPVVLIDQAYDDTASAEAHAYVFDVETGAFQPSQAATLIGQNTTQRPTIYVNQSNIVATVTSALQSPRWKRDTWVALPGWNTGDPWPSAVQQAIALGARIVAVQNRLDVNNAYDLSAVLDQYWPSEAPVTTPPGPQLQTGWTICDKCKTLYWFNAQATSVCAAGGQHSTGSPPTFYSLIFTPR